MDSDNEDLDCAICLQKCHHPTRLPCNHIFCFLCVKGIAITSKKCAMCRTLIPSDYFDNPVLLEKTSEEVKANSDITYQWYYEGRNGWWKYDERSNSELEIAYSSGKTECILLVAGVNYSIDFQKMIQFRCRDRTKRRRVKRDVPTLPAKGIAGIKQFNIRNEENPEISDDVNSNVRDNYENENEDVNEESAVENTITNNALSNEEDIIDLTESLSYVNLNVESPGIDEGGRPLL